MATLTRADQALRTTQRTDGFHIRAAAFQPVRAAYVRHVLFERLGWSPQAKRALVVGCGRGLLAGEFARLGFTVDALDPSSDAIQFAKEAAFRERRAVEYRVGDARELPYADGAFDILYYADTLEITHNLRQVLAEATRVLQPGGAFQYDTVNRTPISRLVYLGALQSWRLTRVAPPGRYAWHRLLPPEELASHLAGHGVHNADVVAFLPSSPLRLLRAMLRARHGQIDDEALARLSGMRLASRAKRPEVTYLGYGIKTEG